MKTTTIEAARSDRPVILLAFANDRDDNVGYLRNLPKEARRLRDVLESASQAGLCEVVVRSNSTADDVFKVFQDPSYRNRIAVFHYGGHANGYELLLEGAEGESAAANAGGLAAFLAQQQGLQLVVLNGCSTQQQTQGLLDANVPAVISTSRAIEDTVATEFAFQFYRGLAGGANVQTAFKEAEASVQTTRGGDTRTLYFGDEDEEPVEADRWPWNLYLREGSESAAQWNLPEAVDDPLFGLPPLPQGDLPESPYRHLNWFTRDDAEVFFGRGHQIRELYDRLTAKGTAPILLFYGQSGVGKSSVLDAGLIPRLERDHEVRYLRRTPDGLLATLREAFSIDPSEVGSARKTNQPGKPVIEFLERIEADVPEEPGHLLHALKAIFREPDRYLRREAEGLLESLQPAFVPAPADASLATAWRHHEEQSGKPLIVFLDQVEELYTHPGASVSDELDQFLHALKAVFSDPEQRPRGKLVLGFRKEWLAELEAQLIEHKLPRTKVFLEPLDRRGIVEVVRGPAQTERLRQRYGLTVAEELPGIIADDLLEDRDSAVAPTLQILLTKLWAKAREKDDAHPQFSQELYQQLKRDGILLRDFLKNQILAFRETYPEAVDSGLLLDILATHTTALGTAGHCDLEKLEKQYAHLGAELPGLLQKCQDLHLLTVAAKAEKGKGKTTRLAHDTLAPLIRERFDESDLPGQRARRILDNRSVDWEKGEGTPLDEADLAVVEQGERGTRALSSTERSLVAASERQRRRRKTTWISGVAVIVGLVGLAGFLQYRALVKAQYQLVVNHAESIAADFDADPELSESEERRLWELAAGTEELQRLSLVRLLSSVPNTQKFVSHKDHLAQAILGMDPDARSTTIEAFVRSDCVRSLDSTERVGPDRMNLVFACAYLGAQLPSFPEELSLSLANAISVKTEDPRTGPLGIMAVYPRVVELLDSEGARRLGERALEVMNEEDPEALASLAGRLAASERLDAGQARRTVERLVNSLEMGGNWFRLEPLAESLAALAGRLDGEAARALAERLLKAIEEEPDSYFAAPLAPPLAALARQCDVEGRRALVERLIEAMETSPDKVRVLATPITALAEQLDAGPLQRTAEHLWNALEKEADSTERYELAQCMAAVAGQLDAGQVQRAADRLLTVLEKETDSLTRYHLAGAITALAEKLDAATLRRVAEQLPMGDLMEKGTQPIVALAGQLDAASALALSERLVTEVEKDPYVFGSAGEPLAALAPRLDAKSAQGLTERFLKTMTTQRDADRDAPLVQQVDTGLTVALLVALIRQLDSEGARVIGDQLSKAIAEKEIDLETRMFTLAEPITVIAAQLDADTAYLLGERLVRTVLAKELLVPGNARDLAAPLAALGERIHTEGAHALIELLEEAMEDDQSENELVAALATSLAGLAKSLDAEGVDALAERLVTMMEKEMPTTRVGDFAASLVALGDQLDDRQLQRAVERLVVAMELNPWDRGKEATHLSTLAERLDPEVVRALVGERLQKLLEKENDPREVAMLAELLVRLTGPLDVEVVRRLGARLVTVLKSPTLSPPVRSALVIALAKVHGADPAELGITKTEEEYELDRYMLAAWAENPSRNFDISAPAAVVAP